MPNDTVTSTERRQLYPALKPTRTGELKVSPLHTIYYEESGNPHGRPVAVVHGGPGGGSNGLMRRYHDPEHYRIILFDQRGCGRSMPTACLEENTTWHLVEDMERLREHLGVDRWQLFGGSWGSTLSVAYAESHPDRVLELVLRGIFMLRRSEIEWFYQQGCSWIYPDAFDDYQRPIPKAERADMVAAYHKRLTGDDAKIQLEAAKAWSVWEGSTLALLQDEGRIQRFASDAYALTFARIECHYFINGGFLNSDDQLIADAHRLKGIPGIIVHGRYDVVTPVKNAWDLTRTWPDADLRIVPDSGHAMTEPGNIDQLVRATDGFIDS